MARTMWLAPTLLALALAGCDAQEVAALQAVQQKLDAELLAKQGQASRLAPAKAEQARLQQELAQRSRGGLGADPKGALRAALPLANSIQDSPGRPGTVELSGGGKPAEVLGQLALLSRSQPELVLERLVFLPNGFSARVGVPRPPQAPPVVVAPPPKPSVPLELPPEGMLEGSSAKALRAQIHHTQAELTKLDAAIAEVTVVGQHNRLMEVELHQPQNADRLATAVDSAVLFFGGSEPVFATGSVEYAGNTLIVRGPDHGPGPHPERVAAMLHQHFDVQHVDHVAGEEVWHLLRRTAPPPPGLPR